MSTTIFSPKKVDNIYRKKKIEVIFVSLQNSTTYQVKIPKSFLYVLLAKREKVNVYEKHTLLKDYSYFFLLKALTTSGTLHSFDNQKPFLRKYFKVSHNTLDAIILRLTELQLIKIDGNKLHLASFDAAAKMLETTFSKNYFTLTYNTTDEQTLYYLMFALDIGENQRKQKDAIAKKLNSNSSLLNGLKSTLSELSKIDAKEISKLSLDEFIDLLMLWQQKTFATRTVHFHALHSIRVDCNRSLNSLRVDWFLKDFRSAVYIKRKLQKLKIITLKKSEIIFTDCGNRMINVSKQYCDIYNKNNRTRGFRFVDQLHLNFSFTM